MIISSLPSLGAFECLRPGGGGRAADITVRLLVKTPEAAVPVGLERDFLDEFWKDDCASRTRTRRAGMLAAMMVTQISAKAQIRNSAALTGEC